MVLVRFELFFLDVSISPRVIARGNAYVYRVVHLVAEYSCLYDCLNMLLTRGQLQEKIRPVTQGVERPVRFFPATGLCSSE